MGIGMNMQHGQGHAAWTWICRMDMGMKHGHVHAAKTWACSMDTGMQHGYGMQPGYGHAAWTGACSMDMGMQYDMDMMLGGHRTIVALLMHFTILLFIFTVLPVCKRPMMATPAFSFELV